MAAQDGQFTIVTLLVEKAAKVNLVQNVDGNTAHIAAAENGHESIVKYLASSVRPPPATKRRRYAPKAREL